MKTLLLMTLAFSTTTLKAQDGELHSPTEENLVAVSMHLMDNAQELMTKNPSKDCENDQSVGMSVEVKKEEKEGNELFCVCELDSLKDTNVPEKKRRLGEVLGDYVESELTLTSGNDNFLHGGLTAAGGAAYDGDDRGRTFGGGVDYSLTGTEGELKISLDSTGFGKFAPQNGSKRAPDGSYYLNFRERNTAAVRLDKNFSYGDKSKTYLISELKLSNETDEGSLSRAAQENWHRSMKNNGAFNAIQYKYVKEEDSQYAISAVMGVGKKWVTDLGNWKCQTALEAKGGMSVQLSGKVSPEASVYASGKISHNSLPWLALSTWIQASGGFQGKATEAGIMISAEKKIGAVTVKPFIGAAKYNSSIDRRFASDAKTNEVYHVLGVTIKY